MASRASIPTAFNPQLASTNRNPMQSSIPREASVRHTCLEQTLVDSRTRKKPRGCLRRQVHVDAARFPCRRSARTAPRRKTPTCDQLCVLIFCAHSCTGMTDMAVGSEHTSELEEVQHTHWPQPSSTPCQCLILSKQPGPLPQSFIDRLQPPQYSRTEWHITPISS